MPLPLFPMNSSPYSVPLNWALDAQNVEVQCLRQIIANAANKSVKPFAFGSLGGPAQRTGSSTASPAFSAQPLHAGPRLTWRYMRREIRPHAASQ